MKNRVTTLITGTMMQLFLGIIYVWSVLAVPVAEYFNWEVSSAKLTSSFMLSFFVLGILIGGKIQQRIAFRYVVLVGGIMLAIGMIATAFIPLGLGEMIYITYGIIGGFGVGMAYNAIITSVQKAFPEKRGLVIGISVSAFGFSTVIFAPLIEYMIGQIGVKMTFIILGCVFAAVILGLFHFIHVPDNKAAQEKQIQSTMATQEYTIKEMLKAKQFYFITLSLMFATAVFFILNPSFKTLALDRGLPTTIATFLVMITGVANAIGRLAAPYISDKLGSIPTAIGIIAVTALGSFLLCFIDGILLIVTIAIIAFCYGGFSGIYPVITGDCFGLKNVGANYGAIMVGFAFSALVFPMVMNFVTDDVMRFIVLGILSAIGAALMAFCREKKNNIK